MADSPAWAAAMAAARAAGVSLRELDRPDDGGRVERLTRAVWGTTEVAPPLARALQHAGEVLIGADDPEGELAGCAIGFIGSADGWHCHSHIAGVMPSAQGRGVGRALKLGQRARCLDMGIDEMRWTYDPLLVRNAWFNLVRLGAVATRFLADFYGVMDDLQNAGDRSDRFEVRWWLPDADGVARSSGGDPVLVLGATGPESASEPAPTGLDPGGLAEIQVPPDYTTLRRHDPGRAARWRSAAAAAFDRCFGAGLVATAITRDGVYRFEPRCTIPRASAAVEGESHA